MCELEIILAALLQNYDSELNLLNISFIHMIEFFKYPATNFSNEDLITTIATGPVVIDDQKKFLLHISSSTGKYQFIGGRLRDTKSPRENAIDHSLVNLGVKVELVSNKEPLVIIDKIFRDDKEEIVILMHYLAKLKDGSVPTKGEWKWFDFNEIKELERQNSISSPNIGIACEHFLK